MSLHPHPKHTHSALEQTWTMQAANVESAGVMLAGTFQRRDLVHLSVSGHFTVYERLLVRA